MRRSLSCPDVLARPADRRRPAAQLNFEDQEGAAAQSAPEWACSCALLARSPCRAAAAPGHMQPVLLPTAGGECSRSAWIGRSPCHAALLDAARALRSPPPERVARAAGTAASTARPASSSASSPASGSATGAPPARPRASSCTWCRPCRDRTRARQLPCRRSPCRRAAAPAADVTGARLQRGRALLCRVLDPLRILWTRAARR